MAGTGSPCGACKFLRRKCAVDCIFAPYFCSEQGLSRFAAIHKVFGASNASKLLLHVPVSDRCEAVVTIAYEAQARLRDPVYGCVAHIVALQKQVAYLQAQLTRLKTQLLQNLMETGGHKQKQWHEELGFVNPVSPHCSLESDAVTQDMQSREELGFQLCAKKRQCGNDFGDLQALAITMMRD